MSNNALTLFLDTIRTQKLGIIAEDEISNPQNTQNVGEFHRKLGSTIQVIEKSSLVKIVEAANQFGMALYPYSRGFNWGYGSHLPAKDHAVLLDLSRLNQIVSVDEEQGIATIEPGVTQLQLSQELSRRGSRYYLDVTGSGAETSVLGNAIERGIAYGSLRVQQLVGMEILLGNGMKFQTGFGDFPNPVLAGLYPYGLGPDLQSLFFQSNFGIVMQGKLKLSLRPECMMGLSITVSESQLPDFVDKVADLVRAGYLHGIPHIANRERTLSTLAPLVADAADLPLAQARDLASGVLTGDWILTGAVTGSRDIVSAKLRHIKKTLRSFGLLFCHPLVQASIAEQIKSWLMDRLMTRQQKIVFDAAKALRGFHQGQPSDAGIRFLQTDVSKAVDKSAEGFLLCTPLAPLQGQSAQVFSQVAAEQAKKHQVRCAMTLNIISDRILEAVISVHFSRSSSEERDRAHACVNEMTEIFNGQGFYPYRINIDQHARFAGMSPSMAKVLSSIKQALDPKAVIAPGRYGLE